MLSGFRSALTKEMGLYTISSKYRAAHTADQNSQIQKFSAGYEQPETLTFEMVTVRREVVKALWNNDSTIKQRLLRKPEGGKPAAAADADSCQEEIKHVLHFAKIPFGCRQAGNKIVIGTGKEGLKSAVGLRTG